MARPPMVMLVVQLAIHGQELVVVELVVQV
jgi:hypothetical protein